VAAHYLGQVLLATAALGCVPAVVCYAAGNAAAGTRFAVVLAVMAACGAVSARLPAGDRLHRNEALVVSALAFVLPPLALAWPLAGFGLAWPDALFEAVSGITTTGLTVLDEIESRPAALLFTRAWLQWVGGLGVVVLVLALLAQPGAITRSLGFGRLEARDISGGTRAHARRTALIYVGLTGVGFLALWASTGAPLDALLHALAAVSTGGFSSHATSIAALGGGARAVVMALCLAGAVAFYSYYTPVYSSWRAVLADTQLKALLAACLVVFAALYVLAPDAARAGTDLLVLAISAQTTAGFATLSPAALDPASQLVLIGSMLTGGALGSTAGGIKILRLLVLIRLVQLLLARVMMPPSAVRELRVAGARIERGELEAIVAVLGCYAAALAASWLVFVAYGHDPLASLFEVTSALATVGLSAGLVSSGLDPALKGVLCADMLLGRVEAVALIVLLMPGTWIGRRRRTT